MTREEFLDKYKGGTPIKDLIAGGVPRASAYRWAKKSDDAPSENDPGPILIDPVEPKTPSEAKAKGVGGRRRAGAITEQTAGGILWLLFFLVAIFTSEPEWELDDSERESLAQPFVDMLDSMPAPVKAIVNTYAAPGVFAGALMGVVMKKSRAIAMKKLGASPSPAPRPTSVPPQPPPRSAAPAPDPSRVAAAVRKVDGVVADPNLQTTGVMEEDGTMDGVFR